MKRKIFFLLVSVFLLVLLPTMLWTVNSAHAQFFLGWLGGCAFGSNCDIELQRSIGFTCTAATCVPSPGTGDGQFLAPFGITLSGAFAFYISDQGQNRIQVFDSDGGFLSAWGSFGSGDGEFRNVRGVAVDSSGFVYVADPGNNRVQKFDIFHNLIGWAGKCTSGINCDTVNQHSIGFTCTASTCDGPPICPAFTRECSGDGQFEGPTGVAVDSSDNVYVVDPGTGIIANDRVQKFDRDGMFVGWLGRCMRGINCDEVNQHSKGFTCSAATCDEPISGAGDGQFDMVGDVAVDTSGIYVSDFSRIQKFDRDGGFVGWLGKCTSGVNCDTVNQHSIGFTCSSPWPLEIAPPGTCSISGNGSGDGQFFRAGSIAFGSGFIYVADTRNDRVQKFDGDGLFVGWAGKCTEGAGCDTVDQHSMGFSCSSAPDGCTGLGSGSGDGQFNNPSGLVADLFCNLWIVDTGNSRVRSFGGAECTP